MMRRLGWPIIPGVLLLGCSGGAERARFEPEEGEHLPGGDTTNTLLAAGNALIVPAANITAENESLFFAGNSLFNDNWVEAPASTTARDGLGPHFNARSCAGCHFKDGRGRPPLEGEPFESMLLRIGTGSRLADGAPAPDPTYGDQIQPLSNPGIGVEATPYVEYDIKVIELGDGTTVELDVPTYGLSAPGYGSLAPNLRISPRVAPGMIGLGLLEAIPDEALAMLADPDDADGDGVSGCVATVPSVAAGERRTGRFGWKAEQPTVEQQSAGAFLGDMGLTTSLFPSATCTSAQTDCSAAVSGGAPEVSDEALLRVVTYARLLAVPARTEHATPSVLEGKSLFSEVGCAACHTPKHITREDAELVELRSQHIWPYTDLLLHDMGEALSDDRPSFEADGTEWRTPPLWALRFYPVVNGHDRLMHDGRARGVEEAILWHGGEGQKARDAYAALPKQDRQLLVRFVESL